MELVIRDRLISTDLMTILETAKRESSSGLFDQIVRKGDHIWVTCPYHKNGHERHASCTIYDGDNESIKVPKGTFYCFTCKESGSIGKLIGECFNESKSWGEQWILDRFGDTYIKSNIELEPIEFDRNIRGNTILDDSLLENYTVSYDYLNKRKISNEIIDKFEIKYDPNKKQVIFPLRDEKGNLVGLTKRNTEYKKYELPKVVYKPVYLLYYIEKEKVAEVYITESQINSLTLESWGYRSVALLGTGSKYQYNLLNNSGIKHFIIALDPDEAGIKGTKKLCDALNNNCFISVVLYKDKTKDINDLTKEEFDNLTVVDKCEFLNLFNSGKLLNK